MTDNEGLTEAIAAAKRAVAYVGGELDQSYIECFEIRYLARLCAAAAQAQSEKERADRAEANGLGDALYTFRTLSRLEKRNAALKAELLEVLSAIDVLMRESRGVAGLHLNGDVATWAELERGGQLEGWLGVVSDAIARHPQPEPKS